MPAQPEPSEQEPLVVAIKAAPPFVVKDGETWRGVSVELWHTVARELELDFVFEERDLAEMLAGLEDGSVDAAVGALTVTAEREGRFDFGHPFYTSGLGIAVAPTSGSAVTNLIRGVLTPDFLKVLAALSGVLLFAGLLVWLFERRANPDEFGGGAARGLAEAFWWSAVTMTTVGYGDKSPRTLGGRVVALVWMFASIILISSFTAAIASSLTLSSLDAPVDGPGDLDNARVGSVAASTSAGWLDGERIRFRAYATPRDAMRALSDGEIEAVVYDEPVLSWLVTHEFHDLDVLDATFERQDYAFGFVQGSPLREPVNRAVLAHSETDRWADVLHRYLGR